MTDRRPDMSVDERLMDYVYGELSDAEARQVEALLSTSAEARAQVDSLRSIRANFASLPEGAPPPKLSYDLVRAARLAASERQTDAPTLAGLRLPQFALRPAFASMFAVVLLGGAVLTLVRTGADRPASPAEADELMVALESDAPPRANEGPTPSASAKNVQSGQEPEDNRPPAPPADAPTHATAGATTAQLASIEIAGRGEPRPPPQREARSPSIASARKRAAVAAKGARGMAPRRSAAAPPSPAVFPRRASQGVDLDALMEAAPVDQGAMAFGGSARMAAEETAADAPAGGVGSIPPAADMADRTGRLQVGEFDRLPPGAAWGEHLLQAAQGESAEAAIDRVRRRLVRMSVDDRAAYVRIVQAQIASLERLGKARDAARLRSLLRRLEADQAHKEASPNLGDALDDEAPKARPSVERPARHEDRVIGETVPGARAKRIKEQKSGRVDAKAVEEVEEAASDAAKTPAEASPTGEAAP